MDDDNNIKNELDDYKKIISEKTKNYFEKEKKITKDNFSQYLEYVGLLDFWSTEEEKNYFWGVLEKYTNNNELNLEGTLKGINDFFNDVEEQNNDNENSKISLISNRISTDNKLNFSNYFDNIDIEKIRELRKVFLFLNLQMNENISITKIKEILNKYNFIKITQDELIQFLELICNNDKNQINKENKSLTINFELYSQMMSLMEQKLLENNNDNFCRDNNSIHYEVNENLIEMTENLINIEQEIYEYLKGIYDIKNVLLDMKEQIINNYNKIILNSKDENKENLNENILTCDDVFNKKTKEFDKYINEMQINSQKKENKLIYLKNSIFELKNEYQNLQTDYLNIQQNLNEKNDLLEMDEQINKLIKENEIINEQYENRKYEIKNLKKELNEKDNEFNLFKIKYKEMLNENKNYINEINNLKIDNKNLKSNYDQLINEIYIKINQENEKNNINLETKNNNLKNIEIDSNILVSEEQRKIYPSNYDKLLIYTAELDKTNQELNDKINSLSEKISKKEEKLLNLKNELNKEKEDNIILKSQNINLLDKIEDLNKDIEINQLFRPSKMLNQFRLSRLSNLNNNNIRNSNLLFINPKKINEKINNPFENDNNNENNNKQIKTREIEIDSILYNDNKLKKEMNFDKNIIETNKNENENKKENKFDKKLLEKNAAVLITSAKKKMISERISTEKINYNNFQIDRFEVNIKKDEITKKNYITIEYFKNILNNENEKLKKNRINEQNYFNENTKNDNLINTLNNNLNIENSFNKNQDNNNSNFIEDKNSISINENIIDNNNNFKLDKKSESFISSTTSDNILYKNIDNTSPNESYSFSRHLTNIGDINIKENDSNLSDKNIKLSNLRNKTIENINDLLEEKNIPKITSYDFLSLRQSEEIISLLDKYNDNSTSYEIFSDNIFLINANYDKNKFILYITSNYIYILDKVSLKTKKIFIRQNLIKLTISIKNCNMIAFHFNGKEDIVIEILRRLELLYYLRDLLNLKGGKLLFKYSDEFNVKMDGLYFSMNARASINTIAQNFQNSIKFNYLYKLSPGFLNYGRTFKEKFVVLSDVGLLYFDDPSNPPKKLIPINGSEIKKIDEKLYNRKYCFEIRCLNKQNYIFAANTENDLNDWLNAFEKLKENYLKNKVEGPKN